MSDATSRRVCARAVACLLTVVCTAAAQYSGGTGEPNDPYRIATAADLIALGEAPENYDKSFILTADIDLDPNVPGGRVFDRAVIAPDLGDQHSWEGPVFVGPPFAGVLDGNGHTIRHLTIKGDRCYLGLFGTLDPPAVIANLGLEAAEVNGVGWYRGILASINNGSIHSCYSTGTVNGGWFIGGLVGDNWGSITASYSAAAVSGVWHLGGLVGKNQYGRITACWNFGAVRGGWAVGGLVGLNSYGSINTSYSTGAVTGSEEVGGFVGSNSGYIAMSYSTGAVSGKYEVGGLVGHNSSGTTVASFWDTETSGQASSAGGTGLPTASLQNSSTFLAAGWDLVEEVRNGTSDYWRVTPGAYPRLRCQGSDDPVMPEGAGTPEQPYMIRDARDLGTVWFKPFAHYRLEESVDLSEARWSMAVIPWFAGAFDGDGHVISRLYIEGAGCLGLFGQLGPGAAIASLGLEEVDVNGTDIGVGSLAGRNYRGHITASHSSGTISGTDYQVGGLVGYNEEGTIASSYSTCSVKGNGNVGGLVGVNRDAASSIIMSYSTGSVSGAGWRAGGLVGDNEGSITASYSTGVVTGDMAVGGLVGRNSLYAYIAASYSTGTVTGNMPVGGLVGSNDGSIATCYSTGAIAGANGAGGLVGQQLPWNASTDRSFWDIETSGQTTSAAGIGRTTAQMYERSTFLEAGWDFVSKTANGTEDIWWIEEGRDYPRLWWETGDGASP